MRRKNTQQAEPNIATLVISLYRAGKSPELIQMSLLREAPFISRAYIQSVLNAAHVLPKEKDNTNVRPRKKSEQAILADKIHAICGICPYKRPGLPCVLPQSICPSPDVEKFFAKWRENDAAIRMRRYKLHLVIPEDQPRDAAQETRMKRHFRHSGNPTRNWVNIFEDVNEQFQFSPEDGELYSAAFPSMSPYSNFSLPENDIVDEPLWDDIERGTDIDLDLDDSFEVDEGWDEEKTETAPIQFLSDAPDMEIYGDENENTADSGSSQNFLKDISDSIKDEEFWMDEYMDVLADFIISLGN